jgi:type I restriction enzyme S subunit
VYYFFSSPQGQKQILDSAIQTGVPHTNLGICRKYIFPAPTIAEQSRISGVLADIDCHLESLDRLLEKKRQIKQAAMQELLTGKWRLPGFEGQWETVALSQVSEKITGFWGRTDPGNEAIHSTNVIRAGDISEEGRLIGAARRYLSYHEFSIAGCKPGDTVMTASGNGLGKSWTCSQGGLYSASNFVRIIRPQKGKADGYFIGYALKSRLASTKLIEHTATSAYPNLKPSFFHDKWLSLPPEPEQKAISGVLHDIDVEILELEAKKLKASQLKQGMMQQLLTGKIRLQ